MGRTPEVRPFSCLDFPSVPATSRSTFPEPYRAGGPCHFIATLTFNTGLMLLPKPAASDFGSPEPAGGLS